MKILFVFFTLIQSLAFAQTAPSLSTQTQGQRALETFNLLKKAGLSVGGTSAYSVIYAPHGTCSKTTNEIPDGDVTVFQCSYSTNAKLSKKLYQNFQKSKLSLQSEIRSGGLTVSHFDLQGIKCEVFEYATNTPQDPQFLCTFESNN